MKTEVRERLFLPLVLPLAIVGGIVAAIGLFAVIMLWNTREVALVLAIVAAGGVLVAISLLSAGEGLGRGHRSVAVAAGLIPVLLGGGYALAGGGVEDEALLNINRQPHEVIPEDAPVIVATNAVDFDTESIELPAQGEVVVVFENQDPGVPHNVAFTAGTLEAPELPASIFSGEVFNGDARQAYRFESPGEGEYVFVCVVHVNMTGTVTFTPDAQPAA